MVTEAWADDQWLVLEPFITVGCSSSSIRGAILPCSLRSLKTPETMVSWTSTLSDSTRITTQRALRSHSIGILGLPRMTLRALLVGEA